MKKRGVGTGEALAASVLLAVLSAVFIYHSMGFIYAIADDIIMRDIASGAFTGRPDGHLVFIRYALGFLISRLYVLNPSLDWYGFFMTGVMFLGLAAVLYRGFSEDRTLAWKAAYAGIAVGVFGCAMLFHIAQFEWTVSAAMTGAAALYLYVTMPDKRQGLADSLFIWVLLILTYGIRVSVFFMVLPGFGITFLWKFFHKDESGLRPDWRKLILPIAVFVSVGLMALVEQQAYKGEQWEEFRAFQAARSDIYDYYGVPTYEQNPAFFEELGVDDSQLRNLRHYALYLVEDMDAKFMGEIASEAQRQNGLEQSIKSRIKSGIVLAAQQFFDTEYCTVSIPFLIFLAGAVFFAFRYSKKMIFPLLLFLGVEGALWFYLGFMGRLPERVAFSMHLITLSGAAAVFFLLWKNRAEDGKWKKAASLIFLGGFLAAAIFQWSFSQNSNEEKLIMDNNYQEFKKFCRDNPENFYFIETFMAEPVGGAQVTTEYSSQINNCLTLGDWYSTSPLDQERFAHLGIQNVEETILKNPNAYLVVRDVEDTGFLGKYFQGKYPGCQMICQETKTVEGRNYYLYQVVFE